MKTESKKALVYPVILSKDSEGYFVTIPDFDINTQGTDLADAIYMARDAIGIMGIQYQDDSKPLPIPFSHDFILEEGDMQTLVDVDFASYRRKHDTRMVKKNCTIPYYLSIAAEKEGINFSRLLQEALQEALKTKTLA